jgi:hypothetical protein
VPRLSGYSSLQNVLCATARADALRSKYKESRKVCNCSKEQRSSKNVMELTARHESQDGNTYRTNRKRAANREAMWDLAQRTKHRANQASTPETTLYLAR